MGQKLKPPTLAFPLHKGLGLISLFFNASSCVKQEHNVLWALKPAQCNYF
jgi:hypothetical protein